MKNKISYIRIDTSYYVVTYVEIDSGHKYRSGTSVKHSDDLCPFSIACAKHHEA